MNTNKINLTTQCLITLGAALLLSSCATKPELKLNQGVAKIKYQPHKKGTLYLADEVNCSTLFGIANHTREVTPITSIDGRLKSSAGVDVPASGDQIFLATTTTLLENDKIDFWFKFPVKKNKSYNVAIDKTIVNKTLLIDQLAYKSYEYSVSVTDELSEAVSIEMVPRPNQDSACKPAE